MTEQHPPTDPGSAFADLVEAPFALGGAGRHPDTVRALAGELREQAIARLDGIHRGHAAARAEVKAARQTDVVGSSEIAAELNHLGDLADSLGHLADALADARKYALELIGDALAEIEQTSVTVGDAHGFDLRVKTVKRAETKVDAPKIREVVLADLIAHESGTSGAAYLAGAQAAYDALAGLGRMTWSVTKLEALKREIEAEDTPEAYGRAIDLGHAFGRVEVGEPRVTIERVTPKAKGAKA